MCFRCCEIMEDFENTMCVTSDTAVVLATLKKLQTITQNTNTKLMKLIERRSQDNTETSVLNRHVDQVIDRAHAFMQAQGEVAGEVCMTSVVVSALCSLNKRYLVMETAASAAGDRLMDLTSREGDWFLDELHSMSGNIHQLLQVIITSPQEQSAIHVDRSLAAMVTNTHNVYTALQDLYTNFRR